MKRNHNFNLPIEMTGAKLFQIVQTIQKIERAFDAEQPLLVGKYLRSFIKEYPGFASNFKSTPTIAGITNQHLSVPSFKYSRTEKETFIKALYETFDIPKDIRTMMEFIDFNFSKLNENDSFPFIPGNKLIQIIQKIREVTQAFDDNQAKKVQEYHDRFIKEEPNFAAMFFFTAPPIVQAIKSKSDKSEKAVYVNMLFEVFDLSPAIRSIIKLPAIKFSSSNTSAPHKNDKSPIYISPDELIQNVEEKTNLSDVDYLGEDGNENPCLIS